MIVGQARAPRPRPKRAPLTHLTHLPGVPHEDTSHEQESRKEGAGSTHLTQARQGKARPVTAVYPHTASSHHVPAPAPRPAVCCHTNLLNAFQNAHPEDAPSDACSHRVGQRIPAGRASRPSQDRSGEACV